MVMRAVVQVCATREWRCLGEQLALPAPGRRTPAGPVVRHRLEPHWELLLLHSGTGKIQAAGSTQYALCTWDPDVLVLIGTCGAVDPALRELDVLLATSALVYDIRCPVPRVNQQKIRELTTQLPATWRLDGCPHPLTRGVLATGDGDPTPGEVDQLRSSHRVVAVDWEAGAVAKVCALNQCRCLILRGVSDRLGPDGDAMVPAYQRNTPLVMERVWATAISILRQYESRDQLPPEAPA